MAAAQLPPDDSLDLEMDVSLPQWARDAIDALDTATTIGRIAALIQPLKLAPEGQAKQAVRAAKDAAVRRIRSTERATFLAMLSLVWVTLWRSLGDALVPPSAAQVATVVQIASAPQPKAAAPAPRVLNGTYSKLRNGDWGARITHAASRPVVVGSVVLVTRKNGSTQRHSVTDVVWTDGSVSLCSIGDAPAEQAPAAQRQAIPVIAATEAETAPIAASSDNSTLAGDLASIAAQGASNAAVQASGSMAGGTMRGVGFSSAAGYVTALAHGVKRATAESYKSTLRSSYNYTTEQINALTVTIIPETALPVGQGITHAPVVDAMAMNRAERNALWRQSPVVNAGEQAAKQAQIEAEAASKAVLVAGLVASGRGLLVSPGHALRGRNSEIPRATFIAALETIGRADLKPRIKSNAAQFGEVMKSLGGLGLRSWSATRKDAAKAGEAWPSNVVSRFIVGTLDGGAQLGSLGDKVLIAELLRDNTVRFTGGTETITERVIGAFTARVTEQSYDTGDLLTWLRDTLYDEFHAQEYGGFIFVPGTDEHTRQVKVLIAAVKHLLGRNVGIGRTMTDDTLAEGIAETLAASVAELEKKLIEAYAEAADKARAAAKADETNDDAACELAARRAVPGATWAANRLADLAKLAPTIDGYAPMIGDRAKPIRAAVASLRDRLTPLCDDTSARAAMLELD